MGNIYTRTGDKGQTSLFGGKRVYKNNLKVDCYGTIDEANSMLGLAYSQTEKKNIKEYINEIQKKLFSVGAELASDEKGLEMLKDKLTDKDITRLESIVDKCYEITGVQTEFVIPGVNQASASLHVARTIIRRAERKVITLSENENLREVLLRYINRLSDAIYAIARLEETYVEIDQVKARALEMIVKNLDLKEENNYEVEYNLENIKIMAEFAEEKAKDLNVPIVFTAVDSGGNILLLHRMKDSLLASIDISINKAFTANAFKLPTHQLAEISNPNNELYGIQNTNNGRIVIFGGGFPFVYRGRIVGGIGVSGGSVEEDMKIGLYALEKLKKGKWQYEC